MHFCSDELYAIMALFPFLGYFLFRGRHLWHHLRGHQVTPKEDGCCPPGHEHPEETQKELV